jgi:hopanoid biosynthesis associated RND transporter like protein HpnN
MNTVAAVGRGLARLVQLSTRRPVLTVVLSLALAVAALAYTQRHLTFLTSAYRLLPQSARYITVLRQYLADFGEFNDIVIAVAAPDPDQAKRYARRLAEELRQVDLGGRLSYRVDPAYFEGRALLYLPLGDLRALRDRLWDSQEFLARYAAQPTLARLLDALNAQIANRMALGFLDLGLETREAADLRFLDALLGQLQSHLAGTAAYRSPWGTAFSLGRLDEPDAGYFVSRDGRLLFMFAEPRRREGDFKDNRDRITTIRGAVARLRAEYPAVEAGVTGSPALGNDEMSAAFDDSKVATALAFAFTLGVLLLAFRRVVKPVLMLATLAVSLAWSMGLITLGVGHLSIFSVMFISIVVGIGIDYGIYLLFRYEEERALGAGMADALARTAARTGPGMLLGALTAAGAFLVLMLTDFQGIREFGFVAGTAIAMAFVSMLTLFPALIALVDGRRASAAPAPDVVPAARWLERVVAFRKSILALAAAGTALAVWGASGVGFSYNLLKLQAKGVESVAWEERILATAGRSGLSALSSAGDLDELRRKQDAFGRLPSVSKVESVLMLHPEAQAAKVELIHQLAPLLPRLTSAAPAQVDLAAVRAALETLRRRLTLAAGGAEANPRGAEVRATRALVEDVLRQLGADRPAAADLERLQAELYRDLGRKLADFRKNLEPRPVAPGEAPSELRARYVGTSGRYLVRIQPAVDIWQEAGAEQFVRELRTVDPDVTGPPITSFEAIRLIRQGYRDGALYALALVVLVTALILRSARGTLLALAPVALGVGWTLGLMGALGLPFTMANVWAVPLIIGGAAEFGLNIYVRFAEGRQSGGPTLPQSGVMGVLLNGLTTMVGFGCLMVAKHQGIFGLGLLLTIGAGASLVASLVVLPVLLERFGPGRQGAPLRARVPGEPRLAATDSDRASRGSPS